MKTMNTLDVLRIDHEDVLKVGGPTINVNSARNWTSSQVVLVIGGKEYTVDANQLRWAIDNCTNAGR